MKGHRSTENGWPSRSRTAKRSTDSYFESAAPVWLRGVRSSEMCSDAVSHSRAGRLHGLVCEVRVPRGCLHLGVAEQFADHR